MGECDLEAIVTPSIFKLIRKAASLERDPAPKAPDPSHSRGNQPTRCPHITDPGSCPPVVFSLCRLFERGQQFDQPSSREPSWHPSGWYKCRGGPQEDQSETSCNHNRERHFRKERDLDSQIGDEKGLSETNRPGLISTKRPDLPQSTHRLEP
jgi:hypothetical protein